MIMEKTKNEIFIEKAKKVHGDKYDYSKVEYVNAYTKVCIICPIHGEFWQTPSGHLHNGGCKLCGALARSKKRVLNNEIFIEKSKQIHGGKYDYSKVEYVNAKTKVCIICPEHGEFWQTPSDHLSGRGCRYCANNIKRSAEEFIGKAREIHGEKYDYSKVQYINNSTKVCIICPQHGEFWQVPSSHLSGMGCKKCADKMNSIKRRSNSIVFAEKSNIIYGNKYDYSNVIYLTAKDKVCIVCPKHGVFWQTPDSHIAGHSCPKCNASKLEDEVRNILSENNIGFEEQKKFEWLGKQSLDFYLPDYHIAIECQGIQHFKPNEHFGGDDGFNNTTERDKHKKELCEENNIAIIYYANYSYDFPYEVVTDNEILIEKITNNKNI